MIPSMIDPRGGTQVGQITEEDIASYRKNGYLVVPGFFSKSVFLERIKAEINEVGKIFVSDFDLSGADYLRMSPTERGNLYRALRYLPSLANFASSDVLLDASRQLGLSLPAVMHSYNIRMDRPHEAEFLFHWHQDITYLLGSLNSMTYWLPLGKVNARRGTVALIPGSHRQGVAPVRYTQNDEPGPTKTMTPKDLALIDEPTVPGTLIEAEFGDLVVFSQFMVHRSTPNNSDQVRWTVQIRHSDLAEPQFAAAGFPFGDSTNMFHHKYLFGENTR